ncbi:hypothetical protein BpHYR1_030565 [Brachionus plicatilis]|uniref:Uncharacterized protein n=1 Tax=Brachionus plicatilis TaxID=10195 RepID=A0A3M7SR08_BRAPC|nr:hypothetical protein BpHYR1_030565 [Brachionus plicatilis]
MRLICGLLKSEYWGISKSIVLKRLVNFLNFFKHFSSFGLVWMQWFNILWAIKSGKMNLIENFIFTYFRPLTHYIKTTRNFNHILNFCKINFESKYLLITKNDR